MDLANLSATIGSTLEFVSVGGPVMLVLCALSLLALTLVLFKLLQFARLRVGARAFIAPTLAACAAGRLTEARGALAPAPQPIAAVLAVAIDGLAHGGRTPQQLREEVLREAAAQQQRLNAHLRGLDAVVTLAPLLGLLGTVLGMIEAFRTLEQAGGQANPALLAGGIWEALLTTAAGLAIAIPAAAALHGLEAIIERVRHDTEDALTRLFTMPVADAH
ncbi:MotA/TolQ/ExbB proton channel family protein [Marichromatium bheemlicum]|uniref:MotA/TolQ/ExbB proton channel family protein n=1 Tax=Marichromatium bheemlicum TaxID=365339 RepID=A0ABX1I5L0_9GAMM|nr:MotA/TolQ/ExbB proton channel family protein [Marichromatium bheemlicum]NKN31660.1 MotA/TolQ/ExbB proton channel family protein [Marichromatium bheemlicum]